MKRLKAEQKRRIAGIIAIVLIITMILSAALPLFWVGANAAENSDYTIEANIGFDGKAKIGYNIPVAVTLTNNSGEVFSGEVSLRVGVDISSFEESLKYNEYAREIELAPGDGAEVTFNVPVKYIQRNIIVSLTEDDEVVASEEFPLSVSSDQDCWLGILSDSAENLTYLSPSYYGCSGDTVDLSSVLGSDEYSEFDAVNTFIVNDFDLAVLSDAQLREMLDIVNGGGSIILGMQSRIGSLDRLDIEGLSPLTEGTVSDTYDSTIGFDIQQTADICTVYKLGSGYIVAADYNFSDSSAVSADYDLSSVLTTVFTVSSEMDYSDSFEDDLIGYTDRLPNLSDNTIKIIFCILYVYIAFIVVLYFILKRKDRREEGIKIIPITALVLSLAIYLISFNTVYKKPIASIINYLDLRSTSSDTVTLKSFINVIAPFKGKLDIEPGGNPEVIGVSDYNYNSYNSYGTYSQTNNSSDEISAKIVMSEDGLNIEENGKTKWDNSYLILEDEYSVGEGFTGELAFNQDGALTGEITNNTGENFSETVIIAEVPDYGVVYALNAGELDNGETLSLDQYDIRPFELDMLDYSEYSNILRPEGYDRDENLDQTYRLELEQDIFEGVIAYADSYGEYPSRDYVNVGILGFSDTPIYGSELRVNDRLSETSPINVFRDEFKVTAGDSILSGLSDAAPLVESTDTAEIWGNRLYVYDTAGYTELSFDNSAAASFTLQWDEQTEGTYIYNSLTNRWEDLSDTLIYSPKEGYTDDEGKVRVRAYGFTENEVSLPSIKYIY